ncbi:hypothetical protein APR41_03060 [Salegentibacter salinarum]|uniref:Carboxypeptidase-like regulatory domain-containing protein n=1 Tax=Salegentibacter salinarum TaxID=447422 RepID=A0A2N0TXX1_9FLAO|nr:carboxypeptidase-like regulatory domain-containing protein [Salegentibacter salinarum]PKD19600.1 hypothetical protein APR41_03060 [Salegentibacter salinarum]SKB42244.1 CarboxypepD_reg-like domain-containing protein [Salegentibacter salinarum]
MFNNLNKIIPACILLIVGICQGQTQLSGFVYSAEDSTALFGTSVYFDGTSIGVSTNEEGFYKIASSKESSSPLIISSLGFQKVTVSNYSGLNKIPDIYLKEKADNLDAVFVETDPWSRKKKLEIFQKEFLGKTSSASKCKILNEEVLELNYRPSTKTLTAQANQDLIIKNRYLSYNIKYNLTNFEVKFRTGTSGLSLVHSVYYEGSSYFEELRKNPRKKIFKNRKNSYSGSGLHFMRALATKKLVENNFRIFHEKFQVSPYKFFEINNTGNFTKVKLLTSKISILYKDLEQSAFQTIGSFIIDEMGNHSPPNSIIFSGEIAHKRMAETLPLNYRIEN